MKAAAPARPALPAWRNKALQGWVAACLVPALLAPTGAAAQSATSTLNQATAVARSAAEISKTLDAVSLVGATDGLAVFKMAAGTAGAAAPYLGAASLLLSFVVKEKSVSQELREGFARTNDQIAALGRKLEFAVVEIGYNDAVTVDMSFVLGALGRRSVGRRARRPAAHLPMFQTPEQREGYVIRRRSGRAAAPS